jgi:two-component system response regulator RpaA
MQEIFTTGQIAKICRVSPRTVSKWFDSGQLVGYRIPGSKDRRILCDKLVSFFRESGMPLSWLLEEIQYRVLLVGIEQSIWTQLQRLLPETDTSRLIKADDTFEAGLTVRDLHPTVVVIDGYLGHNETSCCLTHLKNISPTPIVIYLASEDCDDNFINSQGYDSVYKKPFDVALLAKTLLELKKQHGKKKARRVS